MPYKSLTPIGVKIAIGSNKTFGNTRLWFIVVFMFIVETVEDLKRGIENSPSFSCGVINSLSKMVGRTKLVR